MGPKWKNDECVRASPNTETVNFDSSNVSQAAVTRISCNHLFGDFLLLTETDLQKTNRGIQGVIFCLNRKSCGGGGVTADCLQTPKLVEYNY